MSYSSQGRRVKVSAVVLLFKTDCISECIFSYSLPMFYLGFFFFHFPPLHFALLYESDTKLVHPGDVFYYQTHTIQTTAVHLKVRSLSRNCQFTTLLSRWCYTGLPLPESLCFSDGGHGVLCVPTEVWGQLCCY